ncbi:hypothetical protein BSLG_008400 [Batrachochytrium salamandrivorans]|nr:hypothetical protein BSLG_008400 [Batrachochytrium salamandrivorans]
MPVSIAKIAATNRAKVLANLAGRSGIAYFKGNTVSVRKWTDTEERFRQESNFYYVTGAQDAGFHFTMDLSSKQTCLFIPKYSADHALWSGTPATPAQILQKYEVDQVLTEDKLDAALAAATVVHVMSAGELPHADSGAIDSAMVCTAEFLPTAVTEARVIKSEGELELMRKAARISGEAHIALMKAVEPGHGNEQKLHALFEYSCFQNGAPWQAYTPIVAVGRSGSVLHYTKNDEPIHADANQMLLVDAACEYNMYAADITRTYPIGGKFSGDYKTTYEIVLESQKVSKSNLPVE